MTSIASDPRALKQALATYQRPSYGRSLLEIVVTAGPLALLWGLAWFAADRGVWWLALLNTLAFYLFLPLIVLLPPGTRVGLWAYAARRLCALRRSACGLHLAYR